MDKGNHYLKFCFIRSVGGTGRIICWFILTSTALGYLSFPDSYSLSAVANS